MVHGPVRTAPSPLGSRAGDRTRDYLVGQLRAAGLDVEVQRAIGANSTTGLASFGQQGVETVLDILRRELQLIMRQSGVTKISGITANYIANRQL